MKVLRRGTRLNKSERLYYIAVNKRIVSAFVKMFSIQMQIQNSSSKEIYIRNTDLDITPKAGGIDEFEVEDRGWKKRNLGVQGAQGGKAASKDDRASYINHHLFPLWPRWMSPR